MAVSQPEAEAIIADEGLSHHNIFDEHEPRADEIGIRRTATGLLVYSNDERATADSVRQYDDDGAAWAEFITRLRALNRLLG